MHMGAKMNYPIELIKAFKAGTISRADFCRRYAALQGFNNDAKGSADAGGVYITYRGRTANIDGKLIKWIEGNQQQTASSVKELKIKVDAAELGAATWI